MSLVDLVAPSRRVRIRAIRNLVVSPDGTFALRRLLFTDRDAEVRAAAARKLGGISDLAAGSPESWLLDALGDRSPLVIDAIVRALSRCGSQAAVPRLRTLVAGDRMWWVRRSAIYALASIAGAAEVPVFTAALADPFWRVRHAAVKVLAVLGARDPEVRDEIIAAPASTTITYLRAAWGPVALTAPDRATTASELPATLLDPDPAVVTARLAVTEVDPRILVELLCDPHVPLRYLAAERIADSGDMVAYTAALDWLEEPRIPHVCDTVEYLLDRLGDPAPTLAAHALARADRAGAARWAIGWIVATQHADLFEAARERVRAEPALRAGALRLVEPAELVAWAESDPTLTDAIALELHRRRSPLLARLAGADRPRVRALQLDAAGRAERWAVVATGLADPHHGPRAVATSWLVRAGELDPTAHLADADPAIREAALSPAHVTAFVDDRDPWVARAAAQQLVATWGGDHTLPDDVAAAARTAMISADPWIRAQGCQLPIVDAAALACALGCLADRDAMVRAAALDAFGTTAGIDDRVRALLVDPGLADAARGAGTAWLLRALDGAAGELARTWLAGEPDESVRALLEGVAALAGTGSVDGPRDRERVPRPLAPRPRPVVISPPVVERRAFGRAGFEVAPLAISGAFDVALPSPEAAAAAGVDLFFWEPSYLNLTRFLRARGRRERTRVVAGSYHAEADAIELDVDRALRALRRETLDTFLLFWSRSPARVDREAFAMLERLKRSGKVRAIGFSTHHRELARTAITADPWDVVMIRHSAAHPGIETELLPVARAQRTAILTFSALCYGRMVAGPGAPSATECYRYSLSQPGVTACISAPRRHRELVDNLTVLADPHLPAAREAELRVHGIGVRAESQRFNTLLRQPTRDAAAAARELLAAELPPGEAQPSRRLPHASEAKRARTSLGTSRRTRT